jgi:hypothetical protein
MTIKLAASLAVAVLSASALAGGFASAAATTGIPAPHAAAIAPAAPAAGTQGAGKPAPWKTAIDVPGLSASQGDSVSVSGVACPSVNHCVATGTYRDAARNQQAFITVQENGTWGRAFEVPGSAALNKGFFADAAGVACPATGECTIAGEYTDSAGRLQLFVADEKNGHWGSAHPIPGSVKLNGAGLGATIEALACGAPGDCVVAGSYTAGAGASGTTTEIRSSAGAGTPTASPVAEHAFVAGEKNGTWGNAIQVPGLSALKATVDSGASSVSCAGTDCAVIGLYTDSKLVLHAFVADMKDGRWGNARVVPGTPANAAASVVYCAAPGNCAATGDFTDSHGKAQVWVAAENGGTWHQAAAIPGIAALSKGGEAGAGDITCVSPGNCTTIGTVTQVASGKTASAAYTADERGGTWHAARLIPGTTTAKPGRQSSFGLVSCPKEDACAVGGGFTDSLGEHSQAVTVNEAGGIWGSATPVPGLARLNKGADAAITALACAAPAHCAAGGYYTDAHGLRHTFITTEG